MDSLKRFPDVSREDAAAIAEWHKTDPEAALEFRRFIRNQTSSDRNFHQRNVSLDAITASGVTQFSGKQHSLDRTFWQLGEAA